MTKSLPTYDELPIDPQYPPHTAWGVWGKDDNLGTLNLLTEERVAKASKAIVKGAIFPVNWKLEQPDPVLFGRTEITHSYLPRRPNNTIFDDRYDNFNTQSSTQWDGLRHVAHQGSATFYNNVNPSQVARGNPESNDRLGIHHMARRGIAGRAVLLDYARWALKHNPTYDPFERYEISVQELEQVAAAQGVTFEHGDILMVRTGWMETFIRLGAKARDRIEDPKNPCCAGVKACEETFKWVWDNHFAAVAADNSPFEAFPPKDWAKSCREF